MKPEVSILLPSVRPEAMRYCIQEIIDNTLGVYFEIVLIGDQTPLSWYDFRNARNVNFEIVNIYEPERRGVLVALREAYEKSRGDYVVPMTDDARVGYNWLKPVLDKVKEDVKNIGDFEVQPYNPFSYWGIKFSPFCLIAKKRCEQIGGFMDEGFKSFYGDPDLCLRNHVAGGKLVSVPGCAIFHPENNDAVHKVIANKYTEDDRKRFIQKWEPRFGTFPGDP